MKRPTQKELILDYIERFGSITPMQAFADLGITKLATVVSLMRRHDGIEFKIEMVESKKQIWKNSKICKVFNDLGGRKMIKCEFGKVHFKGTMPMLCMELESILKDYRGFLIGKLGEEDGNQLFDDIVSNSKRTKEELEEQIKSLESDIPKEIKKKIRDEFFKEMFNSFMKEDDDE